MPYLEYKTFSATQTFLKAHTPKFLHFLDVANSSPSSSSVPRETWISTPKSQLTLPQARTVCINELINFLHQKRFVSLCSLTAEHILEVAVKTLKFFPQTLSFLKSVISGGTLINACRVFWKWVWFGAAFVYSPR